MLRIPFPLIHVFQAGYLTIKDVKPTDEDSYEYILTYPNEEIKTALETLKECSYAFAEIIYVPSSVQV